MLRKLKGFTLIELLIVIAIIAILTVAFLPTLRGGQAKARDAARQAAVNNIATAIESLGVVPVSAGGCLDLTATTGTGVGLTIATKLTNIPAVQSGGGVMLCSGGYYYRSYRLDGTASVGTDISAANYVVVAQLENDGNVYGADIATNDAATALSGVNSAFLTYSNVRSRLNSTTTGGVRKFFAAAN